MSVNGNYVSFFMFCIKSQGLKIIVLLVIRSSVSVYVGQVTSPAGKVGELLLCQGVARRSKTGAAHHQ